LILIFLNYYCELKSKKNLYYSVLMLKYSLNSIFIYIMDFIIWTLNITVYRLRKKTSTSELNRGLNNRLRKPKGKSRMDNPETLGTMDTQHTGRRLRKKVHIQSNTENYKLSATRMNQCAREGSVFP
jgi:hypothetical protein